MLALLRFWFRVAGRLLPAAAARLGLRLFLTPGRHPIKYPGAPGFLARARREDLAMPWGRVRVYHWSAAAADAPQVLVAHGWSDSVANLMPLIRRLLAAGFAVTAPDWPAHGASEGRRTNMREWQSLVRGLSAGRGAWHALIGHSLGAFALAAATRSDLPQYGPAVRAERLVLLAGPDRSTDMLGLFGELLAIPPRVREGMRRRLSALIQAEFADFSLARDVAEFGGRVLLVHDVHDRRVPFETLERVRRAAPHQRYLATAGLGHRRLLEDREVLETLTAFLQGSGVEDQPLPAAVAGTGRSSLSGSSARRA